MNPELPTRSVLALDLIIRRAVAADLAKLEWFGMFTMHREIIADAFRRQWAGENLMLVADSNGFPVGQTWIDFAKKNADSVALLWAVRVFPFLQGLGIGARMLEAAEQAARRRGFETVELGVEKSSPAARRFYERSGYAVTGEMEERYAFTPPGADRPQTVFLDEWVLQKSVAP